MAGAIPDGPTAVLSFRLAAQPRDAERDSRMSRYVLRLCAVRGKRTPPAQQQADSATPAVLVCPQDNVSIVGFATVSSCRQQKGSDSGVHS